MANFFDRFDGITAQISETEVGKLALANNFQTAHTGGGCMCWERQTETGHFWICDEGNGLGDKLDEMYLVGQYDKEGNDIEGDSVDSLQAAIDWVNARD